MTQQYTRNSPLSEADLQPDPLAQLELWLQDAREARMIEPGAMALATATPEGQPSLRIVLYKGLEDGGLSFYTSYEGRKGQELAANPQAAATFWWDRLERQVRIEGRVERLPQEKSRAYFRSRLRESQLAAMTSRQSRVVASREELDRRWEENAQRLAGQDVPYPEFWGGYRLVPDTWQFWQGRKSRLHDRLRYTLQGEGWVRERLAP